MQSRNTERWPRMNIKNDCIATDEMIHTLNKLRPEQTLHQWHTKLNLHNTRKAEMFGTCGLPTYSMNKKRQ